jgi:tetratricopeptide (TPR) repeat protein
LPEAIADFQRAVELKPQYPQAWLQLALALRASGEMRDAQAAFERAVEFDPSLRQPRSQ